MEGSVFMGGNKRSIQWAPSQQIHFLLMGRERTRLEIFTKNATPMGFSFLGDETERKRERERERERKNQEVDRFVNEVKGLHENSRDLGRWFKKGRERKRERTKNGITWGFSEWGYELIS